MATGNRFPDIVAVIQCLAPLFHIGDLDRFTQGDGAAVRLFTAGNHAEEGRLTGTVTADNTHHCALGNREGEIVDQRFVAIALADTVQLNHLVPQAFTGGDIDLVGLIAILEFLGVELLKAGQSRLALGLSALGILSHPLQLLFKSSLSRSLLFLFGLQSLLLGLQPGGVVALVGNTVAPVQFENPAGYIIQEVAIVGYRHHGAGKFLKEFFQPEYGFGIQVVGWLVQQQHIRSRQ